MKLSASRALAAALILFPCVQQARAEVVTFRDWTANCDADSGRCELESRGADGGAMRIDRSGLADPLNLRFSAAGQVRPVQLTLGVDRHTAMSLTAGEGLVADGSWLNLVDQRAKYRLLYDMRHGRRLQLGWRTAAGGSGRVTLPLAGLEQALRYIEDFQAENPLDEATTAVVRELLVCGGGDPRWQLSIDRNRAWLKPPGSDPERPLEGLLQPVASAVPPMLVWRGADGDGDLVAMLSETACRSGSGRLLAFHAVVSSPTGAIWNGCCELQHSVAEAAADEPTPAAVTDDWSGVLVGLWPAIRACLDWTPGVPIVLKARSMEGGRVGVRTRNRDNGDLMDCVAPADGSSIELLDTLPDDAPPLPGQGSPEFVPASAGEPGDCVGRRLVEDDDGDPLGWLVDRSQC